MANSPGILIVPVRAKNSSGARNTIEPSEDSSAPVPNSAQRVEKEIKSDNPAIPGNDEISPGVSWRIARTPCYPSDPPAIAHFLRLGNWLISKFRMSGSNLARYTIDLVAAAIDALAGVVEHAIFEVELVDGCPPARGVVFTENLLQIAGQQGRYAVRHGCCFSSLDRLALALADAILAAVNDDCLPSNERRIVACQKQNLPGNVLRFLHPLNSLLFPSGASLFFRLWCGCQSVRKARHTAFAVMPSPATSFAKPLINPMIPIFVAM